MTVVIINGRVARGNLLGKATGGSPVNIHVPVGICPTSCGVYEGQQLLAGSSDALA